MADEPKRIWAKSQRGFEGMAGTWLDESDGPDMVEYVRADITPPAAVVEAMERALQKADQVSRDLGWHRIYDETGAALAALTAWRDAQ